MAGKLAEHKYKGSYELISKLIGKFSYTPEHDLERFWKEVLFCWITGNADMHLKNFSLYSVREGKYSLTPAYDMVATALVMPEDNEELALTLSGKKRKLHRKDFENTFCRFGLNQQVTEKIFDDFQAVLPLWINFIEASFLSDELKEKYIQLIEKKMTVLY